MFSSKISIIFYSPKDIPFLHPQLVVFPLLNSAPTTDIIFPQSHLQIHFAFPLTLFDTVSLYKTVNLPYLLPVSSFPIASKTFSFRKHPQLFVAPFFKLKAAILF